MAITISTFALGAIQADGRRYVTETHSDGQGIAALREYLADIGADYAAILAARATLLNTLLADQEARAKVMVDANPLPFRFQTGVQFLNRLRAFYQTATQQQCAFLANWVLNRIADGTATDAQLQSVFGLTAGQYASLKAAWQALQTDYLAIQAAQGQ